MMQNVKNESYCFFQWNDVLSILGDRSTTEFYSVSNFHAINEVYVRRRRFPSGRNQFYFERCNNRSAERNWNKFGIKLSFFFSTIFILVPFLSTTIFHSFLALGMSFLEIRIRWDDENIRSLESREISSYSLKRKNFLITNPASSMFLPLLVQAFRINFNDTRLSKNIIIVSRSENNISR